MKTIKTLAGEIGVTKQAVFQKMKKEPLASHLNDLITKIDGTVYVCPEGEDLIRDQFYKTQRVFAATHMDAGLINTVRDSLNVLQSQLAKKDRQIDILSLHISIKNRQIENLSGQIQGLNEALVLAQEQTKTAQTLHADDIRRETLELLIQSQKNTKKEKFWKGFLKNKSKTNTPPTGL